MALGFSILVWTVQKIMFHICTQPHVIFPSMTLCVCVCVCVCVERYGSLRQYSCLENFMDRRTWQATVHGVHRVGHT